MHSKVIEGGGTPNTRVHPWPSWRVPQWLQEWVWVFQFLEQTSHKRTSLGAKVRPRFTHQKVAKELHVGDHTLLLSKALLWAVKTLISCKPTRYFCFVILLERAEHSSDIFQFTEQAGERKGAGEARGIEVFQEPDTSKNITMFDGGSWLSCHSATPKLEMAPHCLRWGLPGLSSFPVPLGAALPAGAWYISYEGWHTVPWMCHMYSSSQRSFMPCLHQESPFPPFSDWKKNPFVFLAHLECGCLCEVFPDSPSMLKALIPPCSAPLPTTSHDPSILFSCTWICLPLKTISAYGQGWHSIYLCTLQ